MGTNRQADASKESGLSVLALLADSLVAPADIVIENARIWSDGLPGFARFAAIHNGRFVYVGETNTSYIGPKTQRVNAGGKVVLRSVSRGIVTAEDGEVRRGLDRREKSSGELCDPRRPLR